MHDVLEQIENILDQPAESEFDKDQDLFNRVVDFIITLEPDSLSDEQIEEVISILDQLEFKEEEDDLAEQKQKRRPKLAKKSSVKKRQYSRKYTRKNRMRIRRKKVLFKRSADGRKRTALKKRMATRFKTPTGRRKVRYHKTRGGQGGKRPKKKEEKKQ